MEMNNRRPPGTQADGVLVKTHPALCLGWGNCHRFGPTVYPLDADGKVDVHRLAVPPEHVEDAWMGAAACPERAITVIGQRTHSHTHDR